MEKTVLLCLCCMVGVILAKVADLPAKQEEEKEEDKEEEEEKEKARAKSFPFPLYSICGFTREPITESEINGCRPLSTVYSSSCSGKCDSSESINPASDPSDMDDSCTCCKAVSTTPVTVELACGSLQPLAIMTATCDNRMKVYLNGVLQSTPSSVNDWHVSTTFSVPQSTEVIAIECEDVDAYSVGGILASVGYNGGVVTDSTWTCSYQYSSGWAQPGFSVSSPWAPAIEIGVHGMPPWGMIGGIRGQAKWIWTPGWRGQHRHVYCRKVVIPTIKWFTYTEIDSCSCQSCV